MPDPEFSSNENTYDFRKFPYAIIGERRLKQQDFIQIPKDSLEQLLDDIDSYMQRAGFTKRTNEYHTTYSDKDCPKREEPIAIARTNIIIDGKSYAGANIILRHTYSNERNNNGKQAEQAIYSIKAMIEQFGIFGGPVDYIRKVLPTIEDDETGYTLVVKIEEHDIEIYPLISTPPTAPTPNPTQPA